MREILLLQRRICILEQHNEYLQNRVDQLEALLKRYLEFLESLRKDEKN